MPTVTKAPPYSNYNYEVNYSDLDSPSAIDAAALADIKSYLTPHQFEVLEGCARNVVAGHMTIDELNFTMGFAGITGRPFHAFCRRYCLTPYREWMASEPDPIETDEQGFTINNPKPSQ